MLPAAVLAVVAAAVHLGVQWVVHLVVYPALAEAARADDAGGPAAQVVHTRRMAVVIAPVYAGIALGTGALALLRVPTGGTTAALAVLAAALVAAVVVLTWLGAVPAHRALLSAPVEHRAQLHHRLRRVDRGRLLLAAAHLSVVLAVAVR